VQGAVGNDLVPQGTELLLSSVDAAKASVSIVAVSATGARLDGFECSPRRQIVSDYADDPEVLTPALNEISAVGDENRERGSEEGNDEIRYEGTPVHDGTLTSCSSGSGR
jgi:hypothetical protein